MAWTLLGLIHTRHNIAIKRYKDIAIIRYKDIAIIRYKDIVIKRYFWAMDFNDNQGKLL